MTDRTIGSFTILVLAALVTFVLSRFNAKTRHKELAVLYGCVSILLIGASLYVLLGG